jgi:hypothetical protein
LEVLVAGDILPAKLVLDAVDDAVQLVNVVLEMVKLLLLTVVFLLNMFDMLSPPL